MYDFIETIKLLDSQWYHLDYHQQRLNEVAEYFGFSPCLLQALLPLEPFPRKGLYKTRFLYSAEGFSIEHQAYSIKRPKSLKLVYDNEIDYGVKYLDRTHLRQLFEQKGACDDILIVKNGLLTDSYYANVVFWDGAEYLTPAEPLLKGTKRAQLLDTGQIRASDLRVADLKKMQYAQLINALIDLEDNVRVHQVIP